MDCWQLLKSYSTLQNYYRTCFSIKGTAQIKILWLEFSYNPQCRFMTLDNQTIPQRRIGCDVRAMVLSSLATTLVYGGL